MENRVRAAGVVLLAVGFAVREYLPNWWFESGPGTASNVRAFTAVMTIAYLLIPMGAGLIAVSVVLRGLVHLQDRNFLRWQLAIGAVLIVAGICTQVWASVIVENVLASVGQGGFEITRFVIAILTSVVPAIGVALVVVLPVKAALRERSGAAADLRR